jgi:colicin import membrane protein
MAERQETSVMVSIQEILRDAQSREEQEKVELEQRTRAEEQRRLDELRRRQEEEEARIRSEEDERQRRAFEEKKRHAEIAAMQDAAVERARAETEAKARLAEMNARQEHERHLHALTHDKSKKNLKFLLAGLGVVLFVAAIGGGIVIKNSMDKTAAAVASANELRAQIDAAEEKRVALESQYNAALAAGVDTKALQDEIAAEKDKIAALQQGSTAPPKPHYGGGGVTPAPKPAGGGGPAKPCNCTPGDPLCSCL